ncbi:hypothetical protein [Calycomorphotria hydatis]|uniref:Uncharacterized protein n=1 Tax=Calycomorphotria hydatis TaxID=2528027 RepID=A0A517TBR7_9PLAN|nr:hypothetical protein [Calycomorphotria hydatis]QDT65816.1 hypothetical protein V22_30780 [Calycomorphotria hydatis]
MVTSSTDQLAARLSLAVIHNRVTIAQVQTVRDAMRICEGKRDAEIRWRRQRIWIEGDKELCAYVGKGRGRRPKYTREQQVAQVRRRLHVAEEHARTEAILQRYEDEIHHDDK